ncbi:deoxycytidine triphosphate deaminase [Gammaproteobacteria bacterium MFB021]|nr:deoxycytidine triphosphate deaminase [Gammaproteobacteria bacterium MFB021]
MQHLDDATRTELEAAAFRRLLRHLDANKDVQNIDLMILADFCRNCLSKWLVNAAEERGETLDYEAAREYVYGMPYSEWKANHQAPASDAQLAALEARQQRKTNGGADA